MARLHKPEGPYCYIVRIFGVGETCPHYDGTISMEPKCKRFGCDLGWTVSGRTLKCSECLEREDVETELVGALRRVMDEDHYPTPVERLEYMENYDFMR